MFVRQKIEELFMCLDVDLNNNIMKFDEKHSSLFDYCPQRCINLVCSVKQSFLPLYFAKDYFMILLKYS